MVTPQVGPTPYVLFAVAGAFVVGTNYRRGAYSRIAVIQPLRLSTAVCGWFSGLGLWLLALVVVAAVIPSLVDWTGPADEDLAIGRRVIPAFVALGLAGLAGTRLGWNAIRRLARGEALVHGRALLVGAGPLGQQRLAHLQGRGRSGLEIVGLIDPGLDGPEGTPPEGMRVLGSVADLAAIIQRHRVTIVVVALPWAAATRISAVIQHASQFPVDIWVTPDDEVRRLVRRPPTMLAGCAMLNVRKSPISGVPAVIKRLEDIVVASALLLFTLPLQLLVAILIKLDSPGPVFFLQPRHGFNNSVLRMVKFRTMYTHLTDADSVRQTSRGDARVTRVGKFLRRHSLDELPQLYNVLRGNMSIVGPRPHALSTQIEGRLLADRLDAYVRRAQVKPGITGLAQVSGARGELDTHDKLARRVELDLQYIENWSLLLDLKIICQTIIVMVRDMHAY